MARSHTHTCCDKKKMWRKQVLSKDKISLMGYHTRMNIEFQRKKTNLKHWVEYCCDSRRAALAFTHYSIRTKAINKQKLHWSEIFMKSHIWLILWPHISRFCVLSTLFGSASFVYGKRLSVSNRAHAVYSFLRLMERRQLNRSMSLTNTDILEHVIVGIVKLNTNRCVMVMNWRQNYASVSA